MVCCFTSGAVPELSWFEPPRVRLESNCNRKLRTRLRYTFGAFLGQLKRELVTKRRQGGDGAGRRRRLGGTEDRPTAGVLGGPATARWYSLVINPDHWVRLGPTSFGEPVRDKLKELKELFYGLEGR